MRIGVVHVTTEEASGPYTGLITANLEKVKADGTEIVHKYVSHVRRATDTAIAYPTLLNKVDIVAQVATLADEGVDGVFVACSGDPGVDEARTLVDIPVVGPMEATFGLVCGYGRRFGIVTVADTTWSAHMKDMVDAYGIASRFVGLRTLEIPTAVVFTKGFEEPAMVGKEIARACARAGRGRGRRVDHHGERRAVHLRIGLRPVRGRAARCADLRHHVRGPEDGRAPRGSPAAAGCARGRPLRLVRSVLEQGPRASGQPVRMGTLKRAARSQASGTSRRRS